MYQRKLPRKPRVVEVTVIFTPDQLSSLHQLHPDEFSFTRKLITWDVRGRKRVDHRAKRLEHDKNTLIVTPEDDLVPAFTIKLT